MNLTHFSDYTLRVLLFLGIRPEELTTIDEVSKRFKIPRTHLVKVVNRLSKDGHIKSLRGKNGGIRLARDPKTYRIGEIIRKSEPHMNLVECFDRKNSTCPIAGVCELEVVLHEAKQNFLNTLDKYTLADLLKSNSAVRRAKLLGFA